MPEIELPQGTIRYEDTGGQGPAIVFLHGLVMDSTMWRDVVPALAVDHRCVLPTLPLGAHRIPMNRDADLGIWGMVNLVADFLEALDLVDVTLVVSDWGGGMLLTQIGRDERVGRLVICAAEAFDNYPPGLPGKLAALACRAPGGIGLALRQLRIGWLRGTPLLLGWMAKHGVPDDLVREWTAGGLASKGVRRDVKNFGSTRFDKAQTMAATEALRRFDRPALVLWSPEDRVMPREHGRRLAGLLPKGRLVEIADAYVLLSLDQPALVAQHLRAFLAATDDESVPAHAPTD
jgi:pimeloyl-ACP methyl ester carboxylesterase